MNPITLIASPVDNGNLSPVSTIIVCLPLLVAFLVFGALASKWGTRLLTGWKTLTQQFPLTDVHKLGEKFEATGDFAHIKGSLKGFIVELMQEGLLVTASFARNSPILIRWSDVRQVEEMELLHQLEEIKLLRGLLPGQNVRVTVNYGKTLAFNLPKEALAAIQAHVSAGQFHKTASPLDLLLNRNKQKTGAPNPAVSDRAWVDDESSKVDSWWGAVAALMLLQAYSFILLQGMIFYVSRAWFALPVIIPWFLVIALSQTGGIRVMNQYLKTHSWKTALRFLHSPLETFKFWAAVFAISIYLYLLTGHRPVPANPADYHDVGIFGNLAFQLFYLAISLLLNVLWKISAKLDSPERRQAEAAAAAQNGGWTNVIGGTGAMLIGITLIVVCYFHPDAFNAAGVFGYGIIVIVLSQALTRDPRSWRAKIKPDSNVVSQSP